MGIRIEKPQLEYFVAVHCIEKPPEQRRHRAKPQLKVFHKHGLESFGPFTGTGRLCLAHRGASTSAAHNAIVLLDLAAVFVKYQL